MLTIAAGRAGTGKTEYCIKKAAELAQNGGQVTIVVPEQSSYACERAIAQQLGGEGMVNISVRSFKRLCSDIFDIMGGGARRRVSEAHKHALVRLALVQMGDSVKFYRRCRGDHAFFELVAGAADELANAGLSPQKLEAAAQQAKTDVSRAKLCELAKIISHYRALLDAVGRDEAGELETAARLCAEGHCFAGQTVIFDGFSGFTEPEFALITALISNCNVICTLCLDRQKDSDIFKTESHTARRLEAAASKMCASEPVKLWLETPHRYKSAGLIAVERVLCGREDSGERNGVFSFAADSVANEAETVAAEISLLVRERGYRFADIAVLTRNMQSYRAALEGSFERFGIPYFTDEADNLLHAAATRFIICALDITRSFTTEKLLALLKTGLFELNSEQISALENYAFVHSIEGDRWFAPFEDNPEGFGKPSDSARELLAAIEGARAEIMRPLGEFVKKTAGLKGSALVREVYSLMGSCGALTKLETGGDKSTREGSAAVLCLEQLFDICAEQQLSASELMDLMRTLARSTPLSDIPPTLEQVTIAQADRARLDKPRVVFVVGAADGAFPIETFESPLLTQSERELLGDFGVRMGRDIDRAAEMERVYLYRALTAASDRLYISYAKRTSSGGAEPTAVLKALNNYAACAQPESDGETLSRAVNTRTAVREYLRCRENLDDLSAAALAAALPAQETARADAACETTRYKINNIELMHRVLGNSMNISATRIEAFEKCRFAYFLEYVMKIRPLKKAEMNPLEAGSFIHFIAEYAVKHIKDISTVSDDELSAVADEAADEYLAQRIGLAVIDKNARLKYIVKRLKAQGRRLLIAIRAWFAQSDFRPADCELEIGSDKNIKPLELVTPNGEKISIVGKIDRVDTCEINGQKYISVVDYKTGTKKFSLEDVYNGLDLQMLIYLFTLCENGKARYGDVLPAAVLYTPGDPAALNDDKSVKPYRMDGLVLDDAEVVRALESKGNGVFLPVTLSAKSGTPTDKGANKLASLARLGNIRRHIEKTVIDMASALYNGGIEANPLQEDGDRESCDYCGYSAICRRDRNAAPREKVKPEKSVFKPLEECDMSGKFNDNGKEENATGRQQK